MAAITESAAGPELFQIMPFSDPVAQRLTPPRVIHHGSGCHVTDESGQRFLEMASGLWCAGLGFSNDAVTRAITDQLQRLPFYHGFMGKAVRPSLDLAERLVTMSPDNLTRALFANSGSEAVDTAVKIVAYVNHARGRPDKRRIIAREQAYHGSGIISAALTGMDACHHGFALPEERVLRTGNPSHYRCAKPGESEEAFSQRRARELEALIEAEGADTIGAFIGEPVVGSGGIITPPAGYWPAIQEVLTRHDILLIADEVICGFHRTGQPFGSQTFAIRPDIMVLAKQLSAAFLPISAVLLDDRIVDTLEQAAHERGTFGHGFTYSGHPVAAAGACAVLDEYERLTIPERVATLAPVLGEHLRALATETGVGDARHSGLLGGLELDESVCQQHRGRPATTIVQEVVAAAERRGVIFRGADRTIGACPPMIIEADQLDHAFEVLRSSLREVLS